MPDEQFRIANPVIFLTNNQADQHPDKLDGQTAQWGTHTISLSQWQEQTSCRQSVDFLFKDHQPVSLHVRNTEPTSKPIRNIGPIIPRQSKEASTQQPHPTNLPKVSHFTINEEQGIKISSNSKPWKSHTISAANWQRLSSVAESEDLIFSTLPRALSTRKTRPSFSADTFSSQLPLLKPRQLTKTQLLGSGNFGNVYKVKDEATGQTYAQKRIRKDDPAIRAEVSVMETLKKTGPHANLINLECIFRDASGEHMVMELGGKTLDSRLKAGKQFRGEELRNLMRQIANGAKTMANNGYQHNDIKPDNILVDGNNRLKLCDFGVATEKGRWPLKSPRQYMPPEVMSCNSNDLSKIDSWSIGCVFSEMMTGQPLFPSYLWQLPKHDRFLMMKQCINEKLEFINKTEDPSAGRLFQSLMEVNPKHRIHPEQILNKSYFSKR